MEKEAITRLARIGFDNCLGYINFDNEDDVNSYSKPSSLKCIKASDFIKSENNYNIIDVRTENEFNKGSFKIANNTPLNKINDEFEQVSDKSYVFCAGGYRSVIACSILMKNGKKDLINVLGGYSEISKEINL